MGLSVNTARSGYNDSPLPSPVLDTAGAQEVTLAAGVEQTVALPAGVHYIHCDADFRYTHGAGGIAGGVRLPWFASTWLEVVLGEAQDLTLVSADGGAAVLVSAEAY